jgi:meiotic recombination protein SPO11
MPPRARAATKRKVAIGTTAAAAAAAKNPTTTKRKTATKHPTQEEEGKGEEDEVTKVERDNVKKMKKGTGTTKSEKNMLEVRKLQHSMDLKEEEDEEEESNLPLEGVVEVQELNPEQVSFKVEELVMKVVQQILTTGTFEFTIPNRSESNQKYIEELDRNVLGEKVSKRAFLNSMHSRKAAITSRVMQLVHEVLGKGIHITKRDLFYTDVKLFKDQSESDSVLDDVACMVGCTRTSLHVVASDKGLVVGRIQYREAGDLIDCTRMGVGGKAIPPYIDRITDIKSDAEFIILVEKEAAYMRLAEDRFYQSHPCIIITGKGQPDVASRLFLRKLRDTLNIPVLALVDSDPYGLKILSVYCSGSKGMSYDSNHLTTPDIKWMGIRPSDLDKYNLPAQCRLPMTEHDKKMGIELLKEPFIQRHPEWVAELELMLKTGEKAEIQALSSFGFQYITETFLPRKLREGDWI